MNLFRTAVAAVLTAAFAIVAGVAPAQQPWNPVNAKDPLSTIVMPNANFNPISLPVASADALTSISLVGANTVLITVAEVAAADMPTSGIVFNVWSNNTPGGNLDNDTAADTPLATVVSISNAGSGRSPLARWSLITVDSTTKIKQGAFIEIRDASAGDAVIARGAVTNANGISQLPSSYLALQPASATTFAVNWVAAPSTTIAAADKVFFCVPDLTADDGVRVMAGESFPLTVPYWAQQTGTLNFTSITTNKPVVVQLNRVNASQKFFNN